MAHDYRKRDDGKLASYPGVGGMVKTCVLPGGDIDGGAKITRRSCVVVTILTESRWRATIRALTRPATRVDSRRATRHFLDLGEDFGHEFYRSGTQVRGGSRMGAPIAEDAIWRLKRRHVADRRAAVRIAVAGGVC